MKFNTVVHCSFLGTELLDPCDVDLGLEQKSLHLVITNVGFEND